MDQEGFYLVLKPGQRSPLAKLIERMPPGSWLANPRMPTNRARLWQNMLRISDGLEILHTQGLLHRNLDLWSVLATGGNEPDFQLTGFEWSLRLMGVAAPNSKSKTAGRGPAQPASFLEDWKAFGRLSAQLLGISEERLVNLGIPLSDVSDAASVEEAKLLRDLVHPEPLQRLDGEVVRNRIEVILQGLGADIAGRDPKFHLVVQLGVGSKLAEQIADASVKSAEVGEVSEQVAFIADDLKERCQITAIRTADGEGFRLAIQGGKLLYSLSQ
jgi:hypothetical protein